MYCGKCNAYIPTGPQITACLECGASVHEAVEPPSRAQKTVEKPAIALSKPTPSIRRPWEEVINAFTLAKIPSKKEARRLIVGSGQAFCLVGILQAGAGYYLKEPILYAEAVFCALMGLCLMQLKSRAVAILCVVYSVGAIISMALGYAILRNILMGIIVLGCSIRATQAAFALHSALSEEEDETQKKIRTLAASSRSRSLPKGGIVFSVFFILLFASMGIHEFKTLLNYPATPLSLSLDEAVAASADKPVWTSLSGMQWHCDQERKVWNDDLENRFIPLTGEDPDLLVLYQVNGRDYDVPCQEQAGEAVLGPGGLKKPNFLRRMYYLRKNLLPAGKRYDMERVREFSKRDGPGNARLGVFTSAFLVLCGLFLLGYSISHMRRAS